jgi:two-component sensor histidine kinase
LVFELGAGQWNIPGLRTLLEDIIPKRRTVEAYEVEHEFPSIGRRVMLLNARRVFDEDGSAWLIVTELVINALKHGFQGEEEGEILVSYHAQDCGWHLSVSDNGSGAQEESGEAPYTGLGASIVEALAHQLNATVQKASGNRGTTVTITAPAVRS